MLKLLCGFKGVLPKVAGLGKKNSMTKHKGKQRNIFFSYQAPRAVSSGSLGPQLVLPVLLSVLQECERLITLGTSQGEVWDSGVPAHCGDTPKDARQVGDQHLAAPGSLTAAL